MGLNLYDIKSLDTLINNQCRDHINISFRIGLDDRITPELVDYMNSTKASKTFYEEIDFDRLKKMYLQELICISEHFKNLDGRIKLITYMELMRLFSMYEPIGEKASILSQEGLNVGILGKGVCMSQCSFLRDLCLISGMKAGVQKVEFSASNHHAITVASIVDGSCIILDPTLYNGSVDSANLGIKYKRFVNLDDNEIISNLSASDDEIKQARCNALKFLIKKFHLNKYSDEIKLSNFQKDEKLLRILAHLESQIVSPPNANFRSVDLNGREIELGKMLELLFATNGIEYEIIPIDKKADIYLKIELMGFEMIINPQNMYLPNKDWLIYRDGDTYKKVLLYPSLHNVIEKRINEHKIDINNKNMKKHY